MILEKIKSLVTNSHLGQWQMLLLHLIEQKHLMWMDPKLSPPHFVNHDLP